MPKPSVISARSAPDFSAISPYLQLRPSSRAKRLSLRAEPQAGCVYLVLPPRTSLAAAYKFALSYKDWIADKAAKFIQSKPFEDGAVFPIFGENYRLQHVPTTSARTKIYFAAEGGQKKNGKGDLAGDLCVESAAPIVPARVEKFLKSHAHKMMEPLMREKAAQIQNLRKPVASPRRAKKTTADSISKSDLLRLMGIKPPPPKARATPIPASTPASTPALKIKDMKSRWGSCATSGEISLSWRLVFAPMAAIDYVIAHEVAHLVHHNHSAAFWALCRELSVDFDEGSRWMKRHGSELMVYGL